MAVLEAQLARTPHLLGPGFSVADLNVASIAILARLGRCDLSGFPRADAWLRRCFERPAAVRVSKLPVIPPPPNR